ncbi:class I SAM-dependent methyltransferase [Beggiatoa leptomitoformis]|uniref:Methyltransferase domain-containing protein n=1 Tax=Beggiatoa leptomitoformis TaxID=288004 RepID=A0A2N9YJS8_9GAMM|nr:class I SAM-dependent methyltransferase [Beggiatoa leptomitoformis]ALG67747.1 methyltransferase domain-containing protein [Beggiatoa leptomitoformis]AUI70665.2 methyltransferase domain-containing protein [Beggiatoa leptomitoformis]
MSQRSLQLNRWFETAIGQRLFNIETNSLARILPYLFGYHLVQIGGMGQGRLIESSRIRHRCVLSRYADSLQSVRSRVCGTMETLPFAADSIDVAVLPHILEFEDNPHAILREVERILIPEGHVIIVGFNPLSLWGIWRWSFANRKSAPWCGRFIGLLRIKDWLALLGFELVEQQTLFYALPFYHERLMPRSPLFENIGKRMAGRFGAVYIVVAKKRVATLTPLRKPTWATRRKSLVASNVIPSRYAKDPQKQTEHE